MKGDGILSPILFCVYIDVSLKSRLIMVWDVSSVMYFLKLFYADDIILFALTANFTSTGLSSICDNFVHVQFNAKNFQILRQVEQSEYFRIFTFSLLVATTRCLLLASISKDQPDILNNDQWHSFPVRQSNVLLLLWQFNNNNKIYFTL